MSRRQVLAGAGGTGLLAAATVSPAKAATRARRSRAASDGTPEQVHLTWSENPATGVVVSWASAGQARRPRVRIGQRVIPAERYVWPLLASLVFLLAALWVGRTP